MPRLIGLDPGLQRTGWGVVEYEGNRLRPVACGLLRSDAAMSLAERLASLFRALSDILDQYKPDEAAVEETFVNVNPTSTLKLGQARAVSMLVPALAGLPVHEYTPNAVKKAVVGNGHAQKEQVEHMVRRLLPGLEIGSADAADALAVAICHSHHAQTHAVWQAAQAAGAGMIAKLTGTVDSTGPDWAVIDVGGVGYLISSSRRTLDRCPVGSSVAIQVETQVREDRIQLFGFSSEAERDWFRLLQTVQGVGGRVALAILSALSTEQILNAIASGDRTALTKADGVGPKLATRILSELKDKVGGIGLGMAVAAASAPASGGKREAPSATADAVSALVNLGYGRSEAFGAVARVAGQIGEGATIDALIRGGLKELSA